MKSVAAITAVLALPIGALTLLLWRMGELSPYAETAAALRARPTIYGSATNAANYSYKIALHRELKAEVVAWGSSRMMQFQARHFSRPFANLSGTFSSLEQGADFAEATLLRDPPAALLLGIDYWWLHREYDTPNHVASARQLETRLTYQKLRAPFEWATHAHAPPLTAWPAVLWRGADAVSRLPAGLHAIGAFAALGEGGWRADGSWFDLRSGVKSEEHWRGRQREIEEIGTGTNARTGFGRGEFVDPVRLARLADLVKRLRERIPHVTVLLPTIAPSYLAAIRTRFPGEYVPPAAIAKIREAVGPVADFTALAEGTDQECEFLDGWHGGELTAARMLSGLPSADETALGLDRAQIDSDLAASGGRSLLPIRTENGEHTFPELCPL